MPFDLLVFDWDGTLMDSEARIVACIQAAFDDVGEMPPSDAAARDIIGLGLDEAMAVLWPDADTGERQVVASRYRHHFLVANDTPSVLFPGAREAVEAVAARNFLLAVATGKSRRGLEESLEESGLRAFFHATRCADETHSKPHPAMLEQLMDELGVEPPRTLMIGDTEYDMQLASNAGTAALAVAYGNHASERLLQHGPLGCIDAISDLPAWLADHARQEDR